MKQRLIYLVAGIGIGMFLASYLASIAVERRDALIVSMYEGNEGADSVFAERRGDLLSAYVHSVNDAAVLENGKEALGLDVVPWNIWSPYRSLEIAIRVGYPTGTWSPPVVAAGKKRMERLKEALSAIATKPAKGKALPEKQ